MEKTRKLSTIILWALMVVSVVLFVIMMTSIDDDTNPGAKAVQMITLNMNWSMIMFAAATVIVVGFAAMQTITDKQKLIESAIVLVILGVILGVSYLLASGEIPNFFGVEKFVAEGSLNESVSKWVGTGLYATYILFGASFISIAGFGVASMFKKS